MTQPSTTQSAREYDEIDLRDLIISMWQGKWIITAGIIFAMAAALAYLNLVPQTHKGQVNIQPLSETEMANYAAFNRLGLVKIDAAMLVNELQTELAGSAELKAIASDITISKGSSVTFTTKAPNAINKVVSEALPSINARVSQALSTSVSLIFTDVLAIKKQQIKQQQAELVEAIALAKAANIVVGTQQINADVPLYVRGYKVLEVMLDQLQNRELVSSEKSEQSALLFEKTVVEVINQTPFSQINFIAAHIPETSISLHPKIKPTLLLVLSFVLGGMLGVMILIFRNVLRNGVRP